MKFIMKLLSIVIIAVMMLTFLPLTAINVNAYQDADLLEYDDTDGEIAILLYLALAATFIIIIRGIGIIIIVVIIIKKKKK